MRRKYLLPLFILALLAATLPGQVNAQSDLDAFMERVLAIRPRRKRSLRPDRPRRLAAVGHAA